MPSFSATRLRLPRSNPQGLKNDLKFTIAHFLSEHTIVFVNVCQKFVTAVVTLKAIDA